MLNLHAEILRLSFKNIDNLGGFLNEGKRFIYLSNFLNNANNIEELQTLFSVLEVIQMYSLKSFVGLLVSDDSKKNYIENSVFIIKNDDGSSSSMLKMILSYEHADFFKKNNISAVYVNIKNRKMDNDSIDAVNKTLESSKKNKVVFLDDFVGTGTMASNILKNFPNADKIVVTYYIANIGLKYLIDEDISVSYEYIANVMEPNLISSFEEVRGVNVTINNEFCLNTAVSEDFRSPNNNHRYLYCDRNINNSWFPLLARNSILDRQPIGTNIFSERFYSHITEEPYTRDELVRLGFDTSKGRKELLKEYFIKSINNGNLDSKEFHLIDLRIKSMISKLKQPNEKEMSSNY